MTDVLDLKAILRLDDSQYQQGVTQAPSLMSKAGSMIATAAKTYIAVKAVGALVSFGKQSIATGMEFDKSMAQVAATMGVTVDEIQDLRDFAQEMGRTTAFSAIQASEALNYMALAGYDATTSMQMLPIVLNLAAAGTMELGTASDMVTDTQTALNLSITETTELVDKMAKTSSKSNTSVSQLGEAMLQLGATGRVLNKDTTQLSALFGVLADNGIKGAEGGTKLRNILLSIQGKKFDKTFKQLGVEVYDASGEMRKLPDILNDMNKAMEGMTSAEKQKLISNTFNRGDMAAVNALLGTSTTKWNELTEAIDDSAGAAEQMAKTQLDNLQGDVTLFKSAMEGLQIAISDKVTPALRMFTQIGTQAISGLTELLSGGDGLKNALKSLAELFGLNIEEISGKFSTIWEKFQEAMGKLKEVATTVWDIIMEVWNAYGADLLSFAGETFNGILDTISLVMDLLSSLISVQLEVIKKFWNDWGDTIMVYVGVVWDNIKNFISTAMTVIQNIIKIATAILKGDWKTVWESIKTIVTVVWDAIKRYISNIMNGIKTIISNVIGGIKTWIDNKLNAIRDKFSEIFNGIWTTVSGIIEKIKNIFNFNWELPKLKLPHLSITGKFSLVPPSTPKFAIDWYKKAYDTPMLFTQPTVVPVGNKLKGFGDGNGGELVIGMHKLKELVGGDRGFVQNITINSPTQLDPSEVARQTRNANRQLVLQMRRV